MIKFKKILALIMSAMLAAAAFTLPAGAYDYNDYLNDAKDVTGVFSDAERVFELSEVITKSYPTYWNTSDKYESLYDAVAVLADADDEFYNAFIAEVMIIQKDYALTTTNLTLNGEKNSENIDIQIGYIKDATRKPDVYQTAIKAILNDKPEYTDKLISALLAQTDQYSRYILAKDYYFDQVSEKTPIGINAYMTGHSLIVSNVAEGSGAEAAGLIPGDIITKIDGIPYDIVTNNTTAGPENTTVEVTVISIDGKVSQKTIKRIKFSEGLVTSGRIDDTVIIKFKAFTLLSDAEDFEKFYDAAAADPTVKKLVIDLRGNVGGDTEVLEAMTSVLTPEDTILYSSVERDKTTIYRSKGRYKGKGVKFPGKLFVITDNASASSADVMTGVIKNIGGIQVGEPTYGKGVGQNGYILHNGYMAWITGIFIELPTYGRYHGTGLNPNVPIATDVPIYEKSEILPFTNFYTPLDKTSSKNRINAYKQRLSLLLEIELPANGVLDEPTMQFTNAMRYHLGLSPIPLSSNIYSVDTETLKLICDLADEVGFDYKSIKSPVDKALAYCLNYKTE